MILKADKPDGPFDLVGPDAGTPPEQRALDGDGHTQLDSGIIHHADDRESQVTPARQRLLDFDERHPKILAELQAKGG